MRLLALSILLAGCESMEPSGRILEPVVVAAPQPAAPVEVAPTEAPAPTEAAPAAATPTDGGEPFVISSEQMQENAAQDGVGSVAVAVAAVSGEEAPAAASAAPEPTPAPAAAGLPAALLGFPVRLVKTVHEAQPPRAILALQDGSEVVVTPGQLLPEPGLVVLAIGRDMAQLARVEPAGDKATISALTLTAQY